MINAFQSQKYCVDDISEIENYQEAVADATQTWDCHHRAEILPCGCFSRRDLKNFGLYWNRSASELIFLTKSEHHRLHASNMSKSWRKMLSKNTKTGGMLGKRHTAETRAKMSSSHKGLPSPNKGKHFRHTSQTKAKMATSHKGKVWATDGTLTRQFQPGEIPPGWVKGRKL